MNRRSLRASAPCGQRLHPLFQVLGPIPHQYTNLDESRTTLLQSPSAEGGETHVELFGYFLFCQEILHGPRGNPTNPSPRAGFSDGADSLAPDLENCDNRRVLENWT